MFMCVEFGGVRQRAFLLSNWATVTEKTVPSDNRMKITGVVILKIVFPYLETNKFVFFPLSTSVYQPLDLGKWKDRKKEGVIKHHNLCFLNNKTVHMYDRMGY